jgi:hypothetical protein
MDFGAHYKTVSKIQTNFTILYPGRRLGRDGLRPLQGRAWPQRISRDGLPHPRKGHDPMGSPAASQFQEASRLAGTNYIISTNPSGVVAL